MSKPAPPYGEREPERPEAVERPRNTPTGRDRNAEVRAARAEGLSYREIGERYGLSGAHVRRICDREAAAVHAEGLADRQRRFRTKRPEGDDRQPTRKARGCLCRRPVLRTTTAARCYICGRVVENRPPVRMG